MTGREQLNRLKSGHTPLVQALFDEAYACGHKDGRADGEAVIGMLEAARSELAAAQAAPVVEWRTVYLDGVKWHAAQPPEVCLLVGPNGWQMWMSVWAWLMKLSPIDGGPETGPAGKSAAEAAYRKAAGL